MSNTISNFVILIICSLNCFNLCGAGVFDAISNTVCYFRTECCNDRFIPGDINKLKTALDSNVFGQHIAIDLVVNAIAGHWKSDHARKPLTMSFHGMTGSGKNYISQIIAESLYKNGMQSSYVHLFNAGIHFPEFSEVQTYKQDLYSMVKGNVSACPYQLFIFDDVHTMPPGVLDGIKSVIDYHENVEHVDYRRSIFIFLSNTGAQSIQRQFMQLWREGRARNDIVLSDFEKIISQGAFNEEGELFAMLFDLPVLGEVWHFLKSAQSVLGGFFRSETIKNNLIDHYVPFLPLERHHVELCIRLEFKLRDQPYLKEETIEEVINFIEWGPAPENKFAKTGCKRLSQKVAAIASRLNRANLDEL